MGFQNLPDAPPQEADVVLLGVPFEQTVTGLGGTAAAPEAVIEAGMDIEYFEEGLGWSPFLHLRQRTCLPEGPIEGFAALERYLDTTLAPVGREALLVAVGGEHAVTPFLTARRLKAPATVVIFDAHADFRPSYRGSSYNHACAAYRLREQGHRLIVAGVRSFFEDERARMRADEGVELWEDRALQDPAVRQRLAKRLAALKGEVYVSVDMDVFSPGTIPGVGTPQPGGLDWYAFLELFEPLVGNREIDIAGIDLVELVPDAMRISQVSAAKLIQIAVSRWAWARGYQNRPPKGSQSEIRYE